MNKLDFLVMRLKAEQTFRQIMENIEKHFEVTNADSQNLPPDNGAGQPLDPSQPGNIPGGNIYPGG